MGVTSTDGETVICGIIGVAGDLFAKDLRAFNSLLVLDVLRGRDSTGVLGYNKHLKNYDIIKDACDPITLMGYKRYDGIVTAQKQVLIGHNRSATRGKICRANAHPFDADGVCGVHNGTIPWEAVRELKDHAKYDTDSEALFNNIDMDGVENVIPKIWGAWSLVWVDRELGTLNFLRNKERPMNYCFSKDGKKMYWASEAWMLRGVLGREEIEIAEGGIVSTRENMHIEFKIPGSGQKFEEPKVTEVLGGAPKATFHNGTGTGAWRNGHYVGAAYGASLEGEWEAWARGERTTQPATTPFKTPEKAAEKTETTSEKASVKAFPAPANNVVPLAGRVKSGRFRLIKGQATELEHYRSVDGRIIYQSDFERLADHDCAFCSNTVEWGQPIAFTRQIENFICEDCMIDPMVDSISGITADC